MSSKHVVLRALDRADKLKGHSGADDLELMLKAKEIISAVSVRVHKFHIGEVWAPLREAWVIDWTRNSVCARALSLEMGATPVIRRTSTRHAVIKRELDCLLSEDGANMDVLCRVLPASLKLDFCDGIGKSGTALINAQLITRDLILNLTQGLPGLMTAKSGLGCGVRRPHLYFLPWE